MLFSLSAFLIYHKPPFSKTPPLSVYWLLVSVQKQTEFRVLMEIDLNDVAVCVNGGKCEKGEGGCCVHGCFSNSSSCSSNDSSSSSTDSQSSVYKVLWQACAGPLTRLPMKGNVVLYFPQGHLEQATSPSSFPPMGTPAFDIPPQIFCRVVDVQLLANKENDEVYARLNLLPISEMVGDKLVDNKESENGGSHVLPAKLTSHMFCKTLTASDTSTHGGFSVPRRAAEDCFPPLDYKEQRPSQELVAKDLHGVEWKFRHIYRGQPRRHLLTTGWSVFVSQKNLVSGDAVLFLRGEAGELRLGIRRAARPRNGLPESIIKNQTSYSSVLSPLANALSLSNGTFPVFYSPRASHADFIIPYEKYVKSTTSPISVGTRFKMRFDIDDSPERRFSGVVAGIGDADPYRWRNSKWRCLMVHWDEGIMSKILHQERVSPWEIDFSGSYASLSFQSSPRIKKLRSSNLAERGALMDFEDSLRPSKVLQGQENVGFVSPLYRGDRPINRQLDFAPNKIEKNHYSEFMKAPIPSTFTGFLESSWFPKVLQGQEILSLKSWPNARKRPTTTASCFYPLASEGSRNIPIPQLSSFSSLPTGNRVLTLEKTCTPGNTSMMHVKNMNDDGNVNVNVKEKAQVCKIFGFSLTEDVNLKGPSKRSCTKVHKQGSLVGRAIDLSRMQGYDDLLIDLERLFSMEGLLQNPENGWRVLYTDSENDMMVVGDDPWHEFVEVVAKIHIYTQEEVEKLTTGINSDDTRSCLEEAMQPSDSSHTVVKT